MSAPRVLGVIPARHASTRFPGKPLAILHGRPMVEWVWRRAREASCLDAVVVATDDERIAACVRGFGGEAVMTSAHHATGTDRVAEVARTRGGDVLVNVQGDEPLVDPAAIEACVSALLEDEAAGIGTIATPLESAEEYLSPAVVKVACDARRRALYFSRAPIPFERARREVDPPPEGALRHVGLYAYRRGFLERFAGLPPSRLERIEALEQLRALEAGVVIAVATIRTRSLAVDVPADVAPVEARLRQSYPNG